MNTLKINKPVAFTLSQSPHAPDSVFGFTAGDLLGGERVFHCTVSVSCEDNDADLWRHEFTAHVFLRGQGRHVPDEPKVWTKEAVAYVTGEAKAYDLHTALRPFLLECVVDAFIAGYHIDGSYRHDGREWNLNCIDTPDTLELPDLTP